MTDCFWLTDAQMMVGSAADHGEKKTVIMDAINLIAHCAASGFEVKKAGCGRLFGQTKGGVNTKLHAICDSKGRPLNLFVTAGQVSDYFGARALLSSLPKAGW